jgi:hypothetical protein
MATQNLTAKRLFQGWKNQPEGTARNNLLFGTSTEN